MNRVFCAAALTFALAILAGLSTANADSVTLDSAPFSFGIGANNWIGDPAGSGNPWALQGPSSDYTQGDFTLTPGPTGDTMSHSGPTFTNRVLAGGVSTVSGRIDTFSLPIVASYNGSVPAGATNFQLEIELTNLSAYSVAYGPSNPTTSIAWNEVTPGHPQTSSSVDLYSLTGDTPWLLFNVAGNYHQLAWAPGNYYVPLTNATDQVTRTFNFGTAHDDAIDGVEVMGVVHVSYDTAPVPEPGMLALLISGAIGLVAYGWRKRR